jgi:hypothetical protein
VAAAKKASTKRWLHSNEETSSKNKKEIKWSLILEPIDTETLELIHGLTSQQLKSKVVFHTERAISDLDKTSISQWVP